MGMRTRLETKPGESFTATGFLPSFSQSAMVSAKVASLVCKPRITSTSVITGTGFMKCMPMKFSGRLVFAASAVMEMDEVLLAIIAPGRSAASTSLRTRSFSSRCSETASMARSAEARAFASVVILMRARVADLSASVIFAFLTSRSRFLIDVAQNNGIAGLRKDVRDAVAHRARAQHAYSLDCIESHEASGEIREGLGNHGSREKAGTRGPKLARLTSAAKAALISSLL